MQGYVPTAVFEAELDTVSALFFTAEIFSVENQQGICVQFRLKEQLCEHSLTGPPKYNALLIILESSYGAEGLCDPPLGSRADAVTTLWFLYG